MIRTFRIPQAVRAARTLVRILIAGSLMLLLAAPAKANGSAVPATCSAFQYRAGDLDSTHQHATAIRASLTTPNVGEIGNTSSTRASVSLLNLVQGQVEIQFGWYVGGNGSALPYVTHPHLLAIEVFTSSYEKEFPIGIQQDYGTSQEYRISVANPGDSYFTLYYGGTAVWNSESLFSGGGVPIADGETDFSCVTMAARYLVGTGSQTNIEYHVAGGAWTKLDDLRYTCSKAFPQCVDHDSPNYFSDSAGGRGTDYAWGQANE